MKLFSKVLRKLFKCCALLLALAAVFFVATKIYLSKFCFENTSDVPQSPFALVLGAGIKSTEPSVFLKDRLDNAIELYELGKTDKIIIAGDSGGDKDYEISIMRKYLAENSIPQDAVLEDSAGYNTYASLYHARHTFGAQKIIIVTQSYHLTRAVFICKNMGMECYGLSADNSRYADMAKNYFREFFAFCKSCFDVLTRKSPREARSYQ